MAKVVSNGNEPNQWRSLEGRVALVTGAACGVGRAIAIELAHRGASIAVECRPHGAEAESVLSKIRQLGADCLMLQGDISSKGDAQHAVQQVLSKWQRLDILVNNTAALGVLPTRKMTGADWAQIIHVAMNGAFYCTSAALPSMVHQRFGRIINIAAVLGQMEASGEVNYTAARTGIIAFTRTLALEMAKFNITANSIAPGFTVTEPAGSIPGELAAQIKTKIPLGRFAAPEEVAKAAAFLAADGDYITGQALNVSGGYLM
jgi:NAD(P)-dependent dehydrogenase (short-subunit alcohol dehydrogenase family)